MDSYADSSYAVDSDGLGGRDGAWEDAVGMQRTESQSSRATVDSSWTTSTSEHSSATEYSCVDAAFPTDGSWQDASSSSYAGLCPIYETADANQMLSAAGSQYQYQQSDHQLPAQGFPWPSPAQPFNTRAGIEEAARQATLAANSSIIINQQPFQDGGPLFITFEAVDEALQRHLEQGSEEPDRRAVQDVLLQQLYLRLVDMDRFYPDITKILEEAAYQLQIRLQGPEVMEICYLAIVTVLAELTADTGLDVGINGASSGLVDVHSPGSSASTLEPNPTEKEKFKCHYPGCTKSASRQADLERHWIQHLEDDKKPKYLCDYKPCPRHTSAFSRQDHFRDHLRAYHSEDLVRRGKEDDAGWWASRSTYALRKGWWRCSGCLVRVVQDRHGFVCPRCRKPCEKERQRYRRERMASVRGR